MFVDFGCEQVAVKMREVNEVKNTNGLQPFNCNSSSCSHWFITFYYYLGYEWYTRVVSWRCLEAALSSLMRNLSTLPAQVDVLERHQCWGAGANLKDWSHLISRWPLWRSKEVLFFRGRIQVLFARTNKDIDVQIPGWTRMYHISVILLLSLSYCSSYLHRTIMAEQLCNGLATKATGGQLRRGSNHLFNSFPVRRQGICRGGFVDIALIFQPFPTGMMLMMLKKWQPYFSTS